MASVLHALHLPASADKRSDADAPSAHKSPGQRTVGVPVADSTTEQPRSTNDSQWPRLQEHPSEPKRLKLAKGMSSDYIASPGDRILVTGSNGFIGSKVVEKLLEYGFANLRCFVRPSSHLPRLKEVLDRSP